MLLAEPEHHLAIGRVHRLQPAAAVVFELQPQRAALKRQQPAVAIRPPVPLDGL